MFFKKNRKLKNYSDLLKRTKNLSKDVELLISDIIKSENCFMPDGRLGNHFSQVLSYYGILISHLEEELSNSNNFRQNQMMEFQKLLETKLKENSISSLISLRNRSEEEDLKLEKPIEIEKPIEKSKMD